MPNELTSFWRNDEYTQGLFYDLLARAEQDAYDDDFLMQLAAYRKAGGDAAHADIFAAQYLLANGDAENAAVCAERAYRKRPLNPAVWNVLASAEEQRGDGLCAAIFRIYLHRFTHTPLPASLPQGLNAAALALLTRAMNGALNAPLAKSRAMCDGGVLVFRPDVFVGEYVPITTPEGSAAYWCGTYADGGFLSDRSYMMADARSKDWFQDNICRDFPFDLQKAQ